MKAPARLKGGTRFRGVIKGGRSLSDRNFVLLHKPAAARESALGVAAGRKLGSAVARNRIRRRVKEAVRRNPQWLPQGAELVIICRPPAVELDHDALCRSIEALMVRLNRRIHAGGTDPGCAAVSDS